MKLRAVLLLVMFTLVTKTGISQKSVRDSLKAFTAGIVQKAVKKGMKKLAVWDFTDLNKEVNSFGTYIAEQFSVYAEGVENVELMDRLHLKSLLNEHKLKSDGFIDQNTIMQIGKFREVDAVVVGSVIIANKDFQVVVKVIETSLGKTIAADEQFFPIDRNIAAVLGIDPPEINAPASNTSTLQSKIAGNWVGSITQANSPSSFKMLMQVTYTAGKVSGTIQVNDENNQLVFAKFAVEGEYGNGKFTITDIAVKDLYGNHKLCIKNYIGVISRDGNDLNFSGTWNNDSYKQYDFGKIIVSPVKCDGGSFSLKKISD